MFGVDRRKARHVGNISSGVHRRARRLLVCFPAWSNLETTGPSKCFRSNSLFCEDEMVKAGNPAARAGFFLFAGGPARGSTRLVMEDVQAGSAKRPFGPGGLHLLPPPWASRSRRRVSTARFRPVEYPLSAGSARDARELAPWPGMVSRPLGMGTCRGPGNCPV